MAENPLISFGSNDYDENFYDPTFYSNSLKDDAFLPFKTMPQLIVPNDHPYHIGYNDNICGTNNSFQSSASYSSSPENDHTYNLNENQLKYGINDFNLSSEQQIYYSNFPMKVEDDVFQVDKDDLIQGPTLAELNADSSLLDFDPLEFDDIILPGEETSSKIKRQKNVREICARNVYSADAVSISNLNCVDIKGIIKTEPGYDDTKGNCCNEWQAKPTPDSRLDDESVNANYRRTQCYEMNSEETKPTLSANTVSVESMSNNIIDQNAIKTEDSNDEGFDSDSERSDNEEQLFSDLRSNDKLRNQEKYFWQYNLQSKGPKTHTITLSEKLEDPHCLQGISDPVFNPECQVIVKGIKHTGKARRGDGNDLNPSPLKLYSIGKELKKLNRIINEISNDTNGPSRSSGRKEKNKLASRVCRLKKKAQHEANKLKLHALQDEHKRYLKCLEQSKEFLFKCMDAPNSGKSVTEEFDNICKQLLVRGGVAGRTTEFINDILDNVANGIPHGGLSDY